MHNAWKVCHLNFLSSCFFDSPPGQTLFRDAKNGLKQQSDFAVIITQNHKDTQRIKVDHKNNILLFASFRLATLLSKTGDKDQKKFPFMPYCTMPNLWHIHLLMAGKLSAETKIISFCSINNYAQRIASHHLNLDDLNQSIHLPQIRIINRGKGKLFLNTPAK